MIEQPKMIALKSIAIRQENSSSNSSMCSDENNDAVTPMHGDHADWFSFRQVDYLWLFDPEMKFSVRQGFKLEETSVNTEDYKQKPAQGTSGVRREKDVCNLAIHRTNDTPV